VKIEYDFAKNEKNIFERWLSFELANKFDFNSALISEDTRYDYGESRFSSLGYVDNRLFVIVFTPRQDSIRIISLRKANQREIKYYVENQTKSWNDW
jgi:uncharacterized DUF497 family protein